MLGRFIPPVLWTEYGVYGDLVIIAVFHLLKGDYVYIYIYREHADLGVEARNPGWILPAPAERL